MTFEGKQVRPPSETITVGCMEDGPGNHPMAANDPELALSTEVSRLSRRVAELELQVARLNTLSGSAAQTAAPSLQTEPSRLQAAPPPFVPAPPSPIPAETDFQPRPSAEVSTLPPPRNPPQKSLEDMLGSQVFNLLGIVALLFGAAWALKLAIEHGLIGPAARVLIGLVAGAGLILWSELFRRRNLAAFSYALKAVGSGILYLSLWAAFQLFGLVPASAALVGMILVTAWNAFMALTQDAELLASYALIGAFLTPVLLSTGGDHETFLFTYLAAIDLGVVVLQRFRPWPRQLLPAYAATILYFIGYYSRYFHQPLFEHFRAGPLPPCTDCWNGQSTETALFAIVFFALFALVSMKFWTRGEDPPPSESGVVTPVLIPLTNATFLALALYSVWADSGLYHQVAWLMVLLAAVFLGLMRLQRTVLSEAIYLASAIVCLTIAIPLKLSGQSLTTAWLVEGLILYWAATRVAAASKVPSRTLGVLATGSYVLGLASVLAHWTWSLAFDTPAGFFSANLASALVAVAAFSGAAWIAKGTKDARVLIASLSAIDLIALLLTLREFGSSWADAVHHAAFANAAFATALVGLALLAATSWASWRLSQSANGQEGQKIFRAVAYVDLVLFNLVALLTGEREISALFNATEADLQRSLALSGFLMVYGAVLLAAGFWRRSAIVRWQALILILFTIAKVFLFDISGLSAGYRVASFMALGALLLAVSYAYQKDWLGLKGAKGMESGDPT
jgi:uncharacterized membrane protein